MDIATKVHEKPTYKVEDHGKKIAIGTILIMCFLKLPTHLCLDHKELALLLSLVELKPDVRSHTCYDFHHFKSLMSPATCEDALSAVKTLCTSLALEQHLASAEWLYAIPLLHFLGGRCEPFQDLVFDLERLEVWRDECIRISDIERRIQWNTSAQRGKYK